MPVPEDKEIVAVVLATARPDSIDHVKSFYIDVIKPREEGTDGCLGMQIYQDLQEPNRFMFIIGWKSLESRQAHLSSSLSLGIRAQIKDHIAREPVFLNFERIA